MLSCFWWFEEADVGFRGVYIAKNGVCYPTAVPIGVKQFI